MAPPTPPTILGFPYPDGDVGNNPPWAMTTTFMTVLSTRLSQVNNGLFQQSLRPLAPFVPAPSGWAYRWKLKRAGGNCGSNEFRLYAYGSSIGTSINVTITNPGGSPSPGTVDITLTSGSDTDSASSVAFTAAADHDMVLSFDGASMIISVDGVVVVNLATSTYTPDMLYQVALAANTSTGNFVQWSLRDLTIEAL